MISISVTGSSGKICSDSTCANYILSFAYSGLGMHASMIGGEAYSFSSVIGFVWCFAVLDIYNGQTSYYHLSSTVCLTAGCTYSSGICSPAVKDPDTGTSGCISAQSFQTKNALGTDCPSSCLLTGGCSGGTCLVCPCPWLSCMLSSSTNLCWCPSGATATATTCTCTVGYFDGNQCISCESSCTSCTQALLCTTCLALNAAPDTVQGCKCSTGFYGTPPLTSATSCTACSPECSSCTQANLCTACTSINATPSTSAGCACGSGYWGTSPLVLMDSCVPCYQECATCEQADTCLDCISENAVPCAARGCTCTEGYWAAGPLVSQNSCIQCYPECQKCTGELLCTTCVARNSYPNLVQGCTCSPGYWGTSPLVSDNSCSPCNAQCSTCDSQNICITCALPNTSPVDSTGMGCQCNPGYYWDLSISSCEKCPAICDTCIDDLTCITCNVTNSNPNINGTCSCPLHSTETCFTCVCESGYYMSSDENSFSCKPCDISCSTCTGNTANDCILCASLLSFDSNHTCSVCPKGTFNNNSVCENCCSICMTCSDYNFCHTCSDTNKTANNKGKCVNPFYANLTVTMPGYNTVNIIFSDTPSRILTLNDFMISIPEVLPSTITFTSRSLTSYSLELLFAKNIPKGLEFTLTIGSPLYSVSNIELRSYILEGALFAYSPSYSFATVETLANSSSSSVGSMLCAAIANAIISNPAASWALINNIQLLSYLPLSSNPLTPNLQNFCTSMNSKNIIPNVFQYLLDPNCTSAPYMQARKYGMISSVFWINMGCDMIGIMGFMIIWPFVWVLSKIKIKKAISDKFSSYLMAYRYSVFLRFLIQAYLDIGIFSLVQLISVIFNKTVENIGQGYFNYGCAAIGIVIIMKVLVIISPIVILFLSYIAFNDIQDRRNLTFHNKYASLFGEFKNNDGYLSTQYYSLFFLRRLEFLLSQVFLNDYLYAQTIINIVASIFQVLFLIVYLPFKDTGALISVISGEIATTIFMCGSLIFLTEISQENSAIVEIILIYIVICSMLVQTLVCLHSIIISITLILKRVLREKKINAIKVHKIIPIESPKDKNGNMFTT